MYQVLLLFCSGEGGTPSCPGWGYPLPCPDLDGGYPHPDLQHDLAGVPPPRKDMGPVKVLWDGDEVNSPLPYERIDTSENSTFPILRMRAVNILHVLLHENSKKYF